MLLETQNIIVRHLIHDDLDMLFEINNDPECIMFNGWDEMSYEKCQETLYKWTFAYQESRDYGVFCAIEKESKEKIGMCFLRLTEEDVYEVGFRLRKSMWGKGYAGEITEGFSNHAQDILKAKKNN